MGYPKISIVTPNYNLGEYLERTILSVISQGYPNLEYIIIDGGSTDNSIEIIQRYSQYLHYWVSEPDKGLYDALNKGFSRTSGDIMGWINSDDILHIKSLFTIGEIFREFPDVDWLQGYPTVVDSLGRIIYHRGHQHSKYPFYLKDYHHGGFFIQQESTFWSRRIWNQTGAHLSTKFSLAGDFELWMRFYKVNKLYVTTAILGAFRYRANGQLSINQRDKYLKECDEIVDSYLKNETQECRRVIHRIKLIRKMGKYFQRIPFVRNYLITHFGKPARINFSLQDQRFLLR